MAIFVKPLPGFPKRAELFIDDELIKVVSCSVVSMSDLRALPDEHIRRRLRELEVKGGIRYALSHLSRQSVHSKALEQALCRHCLEPDVIGEIIAYCEQHGWLNDAEWVEYHVEAWQAKGKSPLAIKAFLRSKGVSAHVRLDEHAALQALIERRFPQLLSPNLPYQERAGILRSIQRRGFSLSEVQRFLLSFQRNS
jgi:regulatory protein